MSKRRELRDGLKAAVQDIVGSSIPVQLWDGEDQAFNQEHLWPAIFVSYEGLDFGEDLELGAATYEKLYIFSVYVCARGQDTAMDLLESIEIGLSGKTVIANIGPATLHGGEGLVAASMGRHLYVQQWHFSEMESHAES